MNSIIKKGSYVIKTLVYNRTGENLESECEITFNDGTLLNYEICNTDIEEIFYDLNIGIYELNDDGSYTQIENWE